MRVREDEARDACAVEDRGRDEQIVETDARAVEEYDAEAEHVRWAAPHARMAARPNMAIARVKEKALIRRASSAVRSPLL